MQIININERKSDFDKVRYSPDSSVECFTKIGSLSRIPQKVGPNNFASVFRLPLEQNKGKAIY